MGIVRTDEWLLKLYSKPLEICKNIIRYFPEEADEQTIYRYLKLHGMYTPNEEFREKPLKTLPSDVWDKVNKEYLALRKEWGGPNIPLFIFPTDTRNRGINRDFNGKSGLAFKDKLFLFFSSHNTDLEIKAVLTHEYNHVCRLAQINKDENEYTIIDSIILEGLAENAVNERCGKKQVSSWTSYYSTQTIQYIWRNVILPNKSVKKKDPRHNAILYGKGMYPKMAGYCVGYYIVTKLVEDRKYSSKSMLNMNAVEFIETIFPE